MDYNALIPAIEVFKCRCGEIKIKRGDFECIGMPRNEPLIAITAAATIAIDAAQNAKRL